MRGQAQESAVVGILGSGSQKLDLLNKQGMSKGLDLTMKTV